MTAQSLATPKNEARVLGEYTAATTTSDIDISLMAELGSAVTRGAAEASASRHPPWQTAALPGHADIAIPQTAPHTPHSGLSTALPLQDAIVEGAVTAVVATAAAIGGAAAGELLGGDLAASHIGTIAEPLGQYVGRNVGRIAGGALGAASIRCQSRSASRKRSSSQVRFAPEIQHHSEAQLIRLHNGETRFVVEPSSIEAPTTAASSSTAVAQNEDVRELIQASSQNMTQMAAMFGMA